MFFCISYQSTPASKATEREKIDTPVRSFEKKIAGQIKMLKNRACKHHGKNRKEAAQYHLYYNLSQRISASASSNPSLMESTKLSIR
jgi:hypothetical protein